MANILLQFHSTPPPQELGKPDGKTQNTVPLEPSYHDEVPQPMHFWHLRTLCL